MIKLLCQTYKTICVSQYNTLSVKVFPIEQEFSIKLKKIFQHFHIKAEYSKFQVIIESINSPTKLITIMDEKAI